MGFIFQATDKLHNIDTHQTSLPAIMGLGYTIDRTDDQSLVAFLAKKAQGLNESINRPMVTDQTQDQPLMRLEAADVACTAVWDLALGGTTESGNALRSLVKQNFTEEITEFLDDAIDAHAFILNEGLLLYCSTTNSR